MNSPFDPYTQTFNLTRTDGAIVTVPLDLVDKVNITNIKWATIFGTQIGASGLLLIMLAILTKPDKRRAPLFFINLLSLIFVIIRSVLSIEYLLGPWNNAYRYYANDYSTIPGSAAPKSIAQTIIQLLLIFSIIVSLILQLRVVYASSPTLNFVMTSISFAVGAAVMGVYIKVGYENITAILGAVSYSSTTNDAARILFALSICFFTLVFVTKLGMAIKKRRILGMEKFGPLQIIFIMGCQTMFLPAVFCVVERLVDFDGMSSFTGFFVVISLPLSSMWASAQTESPAPQKSAYKPSYYSRTYPSKTNTVITGGTLAAARGEDLETGLRNCDVRVEKGYSVDNGREDICNVG